MSDDRHCRQVVGTKGRLVEPLALVPGRHIRIDCTVFCNVFAGLIITVTLRLAAFVITSS